MHVQVERRVRAAAEELRGLGATPPTDRFVCPLCLHTRPLKQASRAHYPAQAIPCARRWVELLCVGCNSFLGRVYENDARDFIAGVSRMSFTAADGGIVRGRVESRRRAMGGGMRFLSPKLGKEFARMRNRSTKRNVVRMTMLNLDDRATRRALLAWSLLDWFHFAGYRYLASPGAAIARALVLEPLASAPDGLWFQGAQIGLPLPAPEPVLLVRAPASATSLRDADEVLALGSRWGGGTCVLPLASDATGRGWERMAELARDGALSSVRAFGLRPLAAEFLDGRLHAEMRLTDEEGSDVWVTLALTAEDARTLCAGAHPLRRSPRPDATAVESGTTYAFDVVSDGRVP
ncbi:MAG: hypothetical protein AABM40_04545 [Chloroflexota bacterium]